jgi:hypothetical protein
VTLECFKSRFIEESSLSLRPDLSGSGDFIVTEAPEASAARDDVNRLAQVVRDNPGLNQEAVLKASGVARARARGLLERYNGKYWRIERGAHNAMLFFPPEVSATVEIEV